MKRCNLNHQGYGYGNRIAERVGFTSPKIGIWCGREGWLTIEEFVRRMRQGINSYCQNPNTALRAKSAGVTPCSGGWKWHPEQKVSP